MCDCVMSREVFSLKFTNTMPTRIQGKSCMLVAGDVYRPAAIDQLVILGEQVLNFLFPIN